MTQRCISPISEKDSLQKLGGGDTAGKVSVLFRDWMQELRLAYYISYFLPLCFVNSEGKGTGEKGSVLLGDGRCWG